MYTARALGKHRESRRLGPLEVLSMTKWPLAGGHGIHAASRIDYFVLGLFIPTDVVGVYYFAFQLVARAGELLLFISRNVLFPVLSQIQESRDRQVRGVYRAGRALVMAAGVGAALMIGSASSFEQLIWSGQWTIAVPAIAILATLLPGQIALSGPEQLLKARGAFRLWTAIVFARATGVALTAVVVGIAWGNDATATIVASAIAIYGLMAMTVELSVVARVTRFRLPTYAKIVLPVWGALAAVGWVSRGAVEAADTGAPASLLLVAVMVTAAAAAMYGLARRLGWLQGRPG
jgi:hypothetical protein